MNSILSELITRLSNKLSSSSLIAMGVLFLVVFICAAVAYRRTVEHRSLRDFFDFAFPAEIIWHPSARADFLFWITKRAIMPFLLIPAGVTFVFGVGYVTHQAIAALLPVETPILQGPAGPVTTMIFTITMLLAYDISYYLYHVAQHRYPFLWELHKVHHSAEVMVGVTKDRVHPLDDLMNRAWDGVIPGICFGIWSIFALNLVELTVFGINVYILRNILMMDFVRHTHLKISFGPLNHIILCPHWHQLHHSVNPRHYDKNFGLLFSFWDRIFGTQAVPHPDEDFRFGLMDRDAADYQSLFGLWILPLKKMWKHMTRFFRKLFGNASTQSRPNS